MKRQLQIIFIIGYLLAIFFSFIVLIKPGASIFYKKSQIQTQNLIPIGNAYEYQFIVNDHIYDPSTILILEDQLTFSRAPLEYVKAGGRGSTAVKNIQGEQISILFVPGNHSDPAANGHKYRVFIRPYLISRSWGGIFILVLILGAIAFFRLNPDETLTSDLPFGLLYRMGRQLPNRFKRALDISRSFFKSRSSLITQAAANIVLIAFFYIFMEWVFFVTKPSFMDILDLSEKVKILLMTGLAASLLSLLALPLVVLLDILIAPVYPAFRKYAYHLPSAFLASCLCLILIDNFTYTVLKFGIVDSKTIGRILYAGVFASIFIYILRKMSAAAAESQGSTWLKIVISMILLSPSLILAGVTYKPVNSDIAQFGQSSGIENKPNIIILGTDGLNADNMSVYGYNRETTSFINELAKNSLLSEDDFTNSGNSAGSDTALLTSKLPFATHVQFPPDTLKGVDMYQHLPGLLKRIGYRTVSLGILYYVDANTLNFKNAFDAVNCQENPTENPSSRLSESGYSDEIYLLSDIKGRIVDRLSHIFFIKEMQNPYTLITHPVSTSYSNTDQLRLNCLRFYLQQANKTGKPLFAHVHLMGTHGARFDPTIKEFSKDENQNQDWMTDFYDDAILDYNTDVQQIVQYLKDNAQYDNTILILYSDHAQQYSTIRRIPLIIHFPHDQHTGTVSTSTQNMDIAPTILDYMGIQKPAWMEGSSLITPLDPKRLIIAGITKKVESIIGTFALPEETLKPPFYQFSDLSVIQCQNWYIFNLDNMTVTQGQVTNYVNPCSAKTLDSQEEIRIKVGKLLTQLGYHLPNNW